jgi:hypothetical protein
MKARSVEANQRITPTIAHVPTGIVHGQPLADVVIEKVPAEVPLSRHYRLASNELIQESLAAGFCRGTVAPDRSNA